MSGVRRIAVLVCAFSFSVVASADEPSRAGTDPVLDELFGSGADARPSAPGPEWRPGHSTVVWIDHTDPNGSSLVEFDPVSGQRRALVNAAAWAAAWPEDRGAAPALGHLVWRPDGKAFLVGGDGDPVIWDFTTGTLEVMETGDGTEEHPSYSPDGKRIAWIRDNDLWLYDLRAGREERLSFDGSDTRFNGVFDWVYTEEFAHRSGKAYRWSDDGREILWLSLDDSEIPVFHVVDHMETHSRVTEQRYPKPGDPMPIPSLHVGSTGLGDRTVSSWPIDDPAVYLPRFGFTPLGDVWVQRLDREQDTLELKVHPRRTSVASRTRITERDPHWVEPVDGISFLDDGSVLWLSRSSGHMHLVRVASDGERTDLTPGPWEVTGIVGTSPDGRYAWIQSARPNPRERRIFRVDVESGESLELTTSPGTHEASLEPDGVRLLVRSSSAGAPPRWRVLDGDGKAAAEVPVEHPVPRIDFADHRFVEITAGDGIGLDAVVMTPPDFDPSRRHPVVVYTYGGPHAHVVTDSWPRTSGLFNHALTTRGFVVFAVDNRGSAGRSRAFEGAVDQALGSSQLPDQLAGVEWLRGQRWVDPDRIGIWGWSYGGYMTAFALTHAPGTFAAGAAVAPVTDWSLYDSIYTERYMGTPESNPAGYAAASVLDAVAELVDPLLVIHGTGDDNVHLQHTLQLADRAWRAGARFDLVLFPNLGHSIDAVGSQLLVFTAIADFFERHLTEAESDVDG
ncbi:MAG: DPP IV N-terminal domain-containing protein [Thermoanaerobaculales bacterium]|jgi:dipeptidyl-peptidase-4|nr:DPP IV N-terminal domain-containing protein [Thermoanaerobaculales bacterium]